MNLLGLQLGIVSDHPDYIMELGLGIQSIGKLRLRIVVDIIYALKRIYFCNEMKREKRLRHTSCVCCGGYGWMFKAIGREGLTPRSWTNYLFLSVRTLSNGGVSDQALSQVSIYIPSVSQATFLRDASKEPSLIMV